VQVANAQQITISEYSKKDGKDIYFEILGKFDSTYLVYKNLRQKHVLTKYDKDMHIAGNIQLDFIPDRAFNLDFITYPDYFYVFYQYQKNNIVYCKAAKLSGTGEKLNEPMQLDTTKISVLADNKIYTTIYSEDRKRILIYKRHYKNDNLTIATRLFNNDLVLLDSTRQVMKFDERKEYYSDIAIDNSGNFFFAKETRKGYRDNNSQLDLIVHKPGIDSFRNYGISLNGKFIGEVVIKVDNLNRHCIANSFYYGERRGSIEGLFTALLDVSGVKPLKAMYNVFSDSLRNKMNTTDKYRFAFDNLAVRNTFVKRSGGFILTAEDFYTETMFNNNWNRQYYYNYIPSYSSDYYYSNPYYYGYRPWNSYGREREQSVRHYYDDIVVLSLDSSLKLEWNNIIHKKQYDVDDDNYLSFSNMNLGGEIHFFFIDKDKNKQIISDHSVFPNGEIKRYPTLKSNETGYGFMPRLAKQVGARQMIVPYIYLGYIAFAKIDF
jgi:hypothetical protein